MKWIITACYFVLGVKIKVLPGIKIFITGTEEGSGIGDTTTEGEGTIDDEGPR